MPSFRSILPQISDFVSCPLSWQWGIFLPKQFMESPSEKRNCLFRKLNNWSSGKWVWPMLNEGKVVSLKLPLQLKPGDRYDWCRLYWDMRSVQDGWKWCVYITIWLHRNKINNEKTRTQGTLDLWIRRSSGRKVSKATLRVDFWAFALHQMKGNEAWDSPEKKIHIQVEEFSAAKEHVGSPWNRFLFT